MKIRKAFAMSLHAGGEEEYRKRHNPIWAELARTLKEYGVANYSIFLHHETRQLFGYVEVDSEEQWRAIADTEICRQWWSYMAAIMPSNPDHSPISIPLEEVFHLE